MRPISRRGVLSGLGLGVAFGVSGLSVSACSSNNSALNPRVDEAGVNQVFVAEAALLAWAQSLSKAREAVVIHQAHLDALLAAGATAEVVEPAPITSLTKLANAQRKQAALCARVAVGASPRIARLLASIAASNASLASLEVAS